MAKYCDYCGSLLPTDAAACPACGAPVEKSGGTVPVTIDELRAFAAWHRLPLKKMRFFLGEDYPGPKAFGIYQDADGDFVVYKNKADGSRAIRYRGPDEAKAVNELYLKMKAEIINQRKRQAAASAAPTRAQAKPSGRKGDGSGRALIAVLAAVALILGIRYAARQFKDRNNGYYHYNNHYYYSQQDDWYQYDDGLDYWFPVTAEDELADHAQDYYESSYYAPDYGVSDFSESEYYFDSSSSSSGSDGSSSWDSDWDWDDDSDWDWDSDSDWDSDYSDWDSDW